MGLICGANVLFALMWRNMAATARVLVVSAAPGWRMRSERYAWARPMRRRFRQFGGVMHGSKQTKARRCLSQTVAHIVKAQIAAMHAIDAAKLAQPVAGLRERGPYLPGAALPGAALERRHDHEGQQIAGRVVERRAGNGRGADEPNASASARFNPLAVCTSESKPRRSAQGPSWP